MYKSQELIKKHNINLTDIKIRNQAKIKEQLQQELDLNAAYNTIKLVSQDFTIADEAALAADAELTRIIERHVGESGKQEAKSKKPKGESDKPKAKSSKPKFKANDFVKSTGMPGDKVYQITALFEGEDGSWMYNLRHNGEPVVMSDERYLVATEKPKETPKKDFSASEIKDAIEGLKTLAEFQEGAELAATQDAIEGLEVLLELS